MNNELILLAAKACADAYKNNTDLGTTEYSLTETTYQGKPLQILAMPGTNEMADWLWNFHMWSRAGVKRCTYLAVEEIYKAVRLNPSIPLLVTGHSKAGPDALWWKARFNATYCIAFCPAPAFRRYNAPKLTGTTIVIDPDDIVPIAGIINFGHPTVDQVIKLPRDKKWYDIRGRIADHDMDHIVKYFENFQEK